MRITRTTYFFLLMLIMPVAVAAQVHISGKVLDSDSKPIEFATIRVAKSAIGTMSGIDGGYSLSVARQDTVEIIFSCLGYKERHQKLIKPEGNVTLTVKLSDASTELQGVTVTEYRKQTDGMQNLDARALQQTTSVSGNGVEAMLSTVAGVSSKNEMSSQYSVRGGSYDENSVYINGIEVYRPLLISSGQQEGLSIINPNLVGNIQFSTGGFSAEYGDRMSSVLDITYRQPEAFEGTLSGSLMGAEASVGHNTGRFSQLHGFRFKRNASLLSSMDSKGEYDPTYIDYQTNLRFKINDKWNVAFLGNISSNDYKFKPTTRSTSFGISENVKEFTVYFDGEEHDKFETYFGALELNFQPSKSTAFTMLASGFLTNELVSYDISGEYWLDDAGTNDGDNSIGGEIGVGKYLEHARDRLKASVFNIALKGHTGLNHNNLSYGLEYRRQKVYDRSNEWQLRDSAGYTVPHLSDRVRMVYNLRSYNDLETNKISFYAMDNFKWQTGIGLAGAAKGVDRVKGDQILLLGLQQRISRKPAHKHRFHSRAQQPRGNASCRRFILSVAFLQGIPHHADRRRRQLLSDSQQQHQVATEHSADSRQRLHVPRNGPSVQTHSGGLLQESRKPDSLRTRQPETRIYRRECFERIHHGNRLQTLRTVCSRHRLMDKFLADEDAGDAQRRESAAPYGPAL